MNRVCGLWPHLALFTGGFVSALLWQRAWRSADWVPITVRGLFHESARP